MKLSIITVTYNSECYLRYTIESILNQTYDDIEYIIVDGASTDSTLQIIKQYEPAFNGKMRWISEQDTGIYDAMNKGVKMATGEVVGILNSDDFYSDRTVLAQVMNTFKRKYCDALYGDLLYVDAKDSSKTIRYWRAGHYGRESFKWGWMPPHPTFFVRKEVYEKYGHFRLELKSAADYEWMLRVLHKHNIRGEYLPEVLVIMRTGGKSNASVINRLRGHQEDKLAWKMNNLKPYFFTAYLKPLRKLLQFIQRP